MLLVVNVRTVESTEQHAVSLLICVDGFMHSFVVQKWSEQWSSKPVGGAICINVDAPNMNISRACTSTEEGVMCTCIRLFLPR